MIKETLIEVRHLLSDPARWTKDCSARDDHGHPVNSKDHSAVCWCLVGAIIKVSSNDLVMGEVTRKLMEISGCQFLSEFSDGSTHREVLELLDKAIAAC